MHYLALRDHHLRRRVRPEISNAIAPTELANLPRLLVATVA